MPDPVSGPKLDEFERVWPRNAANLKHPRQAGACASSRSDNGRQVKTGLGECCGQRISRRPLQSRLRKACFGLVAAMVTAVSCDLALWIFVGLPHPYAAGPMSRDTYVLNEFRRVPLNRYVPSYHAPMIKLELELDPKITPGISGSTRFTLNKFGFRSSRLQEVSKPPGVVRIFCVGGSTTECLYLDDQDAWPEVLQQLLVPEAPRVNVINTGRSGDSTRDHIALLAHRIVPLEPDIVILLCGVNDLGLHAEPDYSPIRLDSRALIPEPEIDIDLRVWAQARICNWSQIARAAVWAKRRFARSDEQGNPVQDVNGLWYEKARQERRSLPYQEIDPSRYPFPEFEENVRSLIALCRAHDAVPVLLTQPALWGAEADDIEKLLWACPGGLRIRHAQLWETLERFNNVIREIGAEQDVLVVDLASHLPKTTEAFYDDSHFNVSGAQMVARKIAAALLRHPEICERLKSMRTSWGHPG